MRILTLSLNAWNDTLATGNTFSNFFSNKTEEDEFASIFCRSEAIDNSICSRYLRITERDILSGLIHFSSAGNRIEKAKDMSAVVGEENPSLLSASNPRGDFLRHWRPASLLFLRELVWCLPNWRGGKLKSFLKGFKPDIIYMHVHSNWYMHKLLWYCKKQTGARVVVFSGDDVWSYKRKGVLRSTYHWILRKYLRYTFSHANLVCGGSPQLCEEFEGLFGRKVVPLYKTCNHLVPPAKKAFNKPYKAVYCGNLLYGREAVLIQLAKQIRIINSKEVRLQLFIYSNSLLSDEGRIQLNDGMNVFYEGAKPYHEIEGILNECDFSVFAESFSPKNIKETRLSFSTKIIDYMQADSAVLAVGPKSIASIDYLKRSNIAFIFDCPDSFAETVIPILNDPDLINTSIARKYEYALNYHRSPSLLKMMREL